MADNKSIIGEGQKLSGAAHSLVIRILNYMLQNVIICQTESFLNTMLNFFPGLIGIAGKRFDCAFSKYFTGKFACGGTADTVCSQTEILIGIYKKCIFVIFSFKPDISLTGTQVVSLFAGRWCIEIYQSYCLHCHSVYYVCDRVFGWVSSAA